MATPFRSALAVRHSIPMPDEPSFDDVEASYAAALAAVAAPVAQRLRDALAQVEAATSMGGWVEPPRAPGAAASQPTPQLSTEAEALLAVVNDLGADIPFDWPHWSEGRFLAERAENLRDASGAQAVMLINTLQRFDRFSDGALLGAFNTGVIQAAVRRILDALPA